MNKYMDIDGNGVDELLLGDMDESTYNGTGGIHDLFTVSDGKIVHVFSSMARCSYRLCQDGYIEEVGSGSAANSS